MEQGDRLAIVLAAWTALIRDGNPGELERVLDEQVVWQGLLPELVCHNRAEVMGLVRRFISRRPRVTRIEAEERGERVAISVRGADFPEIEDVRGVNMPRSLVFTFRNGSIVRMESFEDRDAAFEGLV